MKCRAKSCITSSVSRYLSQLPKDTVFVARLDAHLCAVYYNKSGDFEIIHGLLDRLMKVLEVPWSAEKLDNGYYLRADDDPTFFPQRYAKVVYNGQVIGKMVILMYLQNLS